MHYLIEVAWLWFWLSHWKNHIFLGYESSYDDVFIFPVARLSPHWYWFNVVESLKVSTQNLPKYKMSWSRSSKVVHAANSLSKVHNQSQTDIVPVAGVFCSLLVENTDIAPWRPSVKPPIVPLAMCMRPYMFPVQWIPCRLRLARLKLTLGSYRFSRCYRAGMSLCELLRSSTSALLCQTMQGARQHR